MIILVDMDGVIADIEKKIKEKIKKPQQRQIIEGKRENFKLKEAFPELAKEIQEIKTEEGFVKSLEPIEGSLEALNDLLAKGHDVRICTSPFSEYKNWVLEKYQWIEQHLGPEWVNRIILTKDKTLVEGDILIDDNPEIKGAKKPKWEHIIFDQPYNRQINDKRRINWQNWKEVLKEI